MAISHLPRLFKFIAASLFLGLSASNQVLSAELKSHDNGVQSTTLDNGLQVVIIPDRRAPVVTHMVWYRVGSADEPIGKSGIAHFLEHMLFKATENYPSGEFSSKVAEIGGVENAFTSYDYTAYFQKIAPSALDNMMRYEADRMRNLIVNDAQTASERAVVIEERNSRVENNPGALMREELYATLYQNHPYRIPVIGWKHEVEALQVADIKSFYQAFYAPNNAVLIVAGDVDAQEVLAMAQKHYGPVAPSDEIKDRKRVSEPEQNTQRTITMRDERVRQPSMQQVWLTPSYVNAEKGEAEALDLLSEILGGGIRSRLYQALIVNNTIAASTGAYYQGTSKDETTFTIWGSPAIGKDLDDVKAAVNVEIQKIISEGVTQEELDNARNRFVRSVIYSRDDQSGLARIYGTALSVGLTIDDVDQWTARLAAVTPDDIKAVAAKYLSAQANATGYLLPPEAQEVSATAEVAPSTEQPKAE